MLHGSLWLEEITVLFLYSYNQFFCLLLQLFYLTIYVFAYLPPLRVSLVGHRLGRVVSLKRFLKDRTRPGMVMPVACLLSRSTQGGEPLILCNISREAVVS